jgi:hypothetical protein
LKPLYFPHPELIVDYIHKQRNTLNTLVCVVPGKWDGKYKETKLKASRADFSEPTTWYAVCKTEGLDELHTAPQNQMIYACKVFFFFLLMCVI